jgi:predicted N-acyltransferase
MADGAETLSARTIGAVADVGRKTWDALANPAGTPRNPFVSYAFLSALEESGSVGDGTGWQPAHLVLQRGDAICGLAPLYVKSDSQGEYVFDHHWAEAYERAGGRYYPKLVCAVPFTPVSGPRLLAPSALKPILAVALEQLARQMRVSSAHANFLDRDDQTALEGNGFLPRRDLQYHWFNRGYRSYDDFLSTLSSRKRKVLKRERRAANEGVVIRRKAGRDIVEADWDAMWTFYQDTGSRKWGRPYLTRKFFSLVGERMADDIMLVLAEDGGRKIAGALNFLGADSVFGRYWGCMEDRPFLHFEICYHQVIDEAIARGFSRVEAGAQGEHKIARGYEPVETRSAHWIADPGFRSAVDRYLQSERAQIDELTAELQLARPFRKDSS